MVVAVYWLYWTPVGHVLQPTLIPGISTIYGGYHHLATPELGPDCGVWGSVAPSGGSD